MPTFVDSSDDGFHVNPPLQLLVAEKVMKKIIAERESYDKKLQEMMENRI
jgi:hypothetical protein